jgi:TetR/AcrR family transcriptional regulator, transcriptional repressor of bet genes
MYPEVTRQSRRGHSPKLSPFSDMKRKSSPKRAMSPSRRFDPEDRKRLLRAAAEVCLRKQGIDRFSFEGVANEAGVTSPLVHHYFKSREQLLAEVYRGLMRQIPSLPKKRPSDLENAIRALIEFVEANFEASYYDRSNFRPWLALWHELAGNPGLQKESESIEAPIRGQLITLFKFIADARGLTINAPQVAHQFDCLLNGLWISWCLDAGGRHHCRDEKASALAFLESFLGPLNLTSKRARRS